MKLLYTPRRRWDLFVIETKYLHSRSLLMEAPGGLPEDTTVKDALEAMDILSTEGKKAEVINMIFNYFSTSFNPFEKFLNTFIEVAGEKVDSASDGWFSKLTSAAAAAKNKKDQIQKDVKKIMAEIKKMTDAYKSKGILAVLRLGETNAKHPFMAIIGTIIKIFSDNKDLILSVIEKLGADPEVQKSIKTFVDKVVSAAEPLLPGLRFAITTAKFVIRVIGSAKDVIDKVKSGPDDFFNAVIDDVGQAPDKNTKLSPFLDLFNMADEFQVMLDDKLEADFLADYRKSLQAVVASEPDKPLSAFDINDALQKYLENKYNDHTEKIP